MHTACVIESLGRDNALGWLSPQLRHLSTPAPGVHQEIEKGLVWTACIKNIQSFQELLPVCLVHGAADLLTRTPVTKPIHPWPPPSMGYRRN